LTTLISNNKPGFINCFLENAESNTNQSIPYNNNYAVIDSKETHKQSQENMLFKNAQLKKVFNALFRFTA